MSERNDTCGSCRLDDWCGEFERAPEGEGS